MLLAVYSTMLYVAFTSGPSRILHLFGKKSELGHKTLLYCDICKQETNSPSWDSNHPPLGCVQ